VWLSIWLGYSLSLLAFAVLIVVFVFFTWIEGIPVLTFGILEIFAFAMMTFGLGAPIISRFLYKRDQELEATNLVIATVICLLLTFTSMFLLQANVTTYSSILGLSAFVVFVCYFLWKVHRAKRKLISRPVSVAAS
jgi:uncharacterized membrane protein